MARLNEPPVPTESIESLKRKFMRQNRDIARANSSQSLRIRNLENETSRLLTENLGLREQILRLQNELANGKSQRITDHTGVIKSQLETKLREFSALLESLGDESVPSKISPQRGKITRASLGQSPDQKHWKNICTLSEAVGGQEGRLPAILENNTYPRRTLERQDLMKIVSDAVADTTDSPEMGPPPVSKFVDEGPVKIELRTGLRKEDNEELSCLNPALSVNLEQRKKRRDSANCLESNRASKLEPKEEAQDGTGQLKTGAKRKFIRDDEENEGVAKPAVISPDDFKFTRVVGEEKTRNKPISQSEKSGSKITRQLAVARGTPLEKQSRTTAAQASRKVLAPKSVNGSPKKSARGPILEELTAAKADMLKVHLPKEHQREIRQERVPIKQPQTDPVIHSIEAQAEPETPAGLDVCSPLSSHPSTARPQSRDTPPPADLGLGAEGQRPSRRARGSVSYAEPNLRDKMRRPTKELVDAVAPDTKLPHCGAPKQELDIASASISVKAEPEVDDAWKEMPVPTPASVENSPLSGKVQVSEPLLSSIITHRRRRESMLHQSESELRRPVSGSSAAALLARNRKSAAQTKGKPLGSEAGVEMALADLDIYEFRSSSPPPAGESFLIAKSRKQEKPEARVSRRHSSVPRDIALVDGSETSEREGSRKGEVSTTQQRQPLLELRGSSASTGSSREGDAEKTLKKASSNTVMADPGSDGSRSDRVSARRRSMML